MRGRALSIAVGVVGIALLVDLFFAWGGGIDGLDTTARFCFPLGVALVLWESLGVFGIQRSERSDSLVGFFLAVGTGAAAFAGVLDLLWGSSLSSGGDLSYGGWIAIPLAALLLGGGAAHLVEHAGLPRVAERPPKRGLAIGLTVAGVAYLADLFLRWGEIREGLPSFLAPHGVETTLGRFSFLAVLALVLWELLAALEIDKTRRSDSLVAFLLATGAIVLGAGAIVQLLWGPDFLGVEGLDYGGWLAIPLGLLVLAGGIAHLVEHTRRSRMSA